MSNDDTSQGTATLLPQSLVCVFSQDQNTIEAAGKIADDWRFARVNLDIRQGDVMSAAEYFKGTKSPNLVIIQTENIDESFSEKLAALAESCDENTAAVIIGPENDVYLYRKLIEMGISDYLVKPVSKDILAEVIAKTLINQLGTSGSRLLAFVGAKGGVGTSTIAQASGWGISQFLGQKTILVDISGGWATHAVGIGFEPTATLTEALRAAEKGDEESLARMIYKASDKFSVLATGSDAMLDQGVEKARLEKLLDMLMLKFPVVLVDISAAAPELKKAVLFRAHHIHLVTMASVACLRLARSILMEIKTLRGGKTSDVSLFVNMVGFAPSHELSKGDIQGAMEIIPHAFIVFDPKLFVGVETEDKKIIDDKAGIKIVHDTIIGLARKILKVDADVGLPDKEEKQGGLLSGMLGRLGKK
jgi:pilus assembly protein CpaE